MTAKRLLMLALAMFVVMAVGCKKKPPAPPANNLDVDRTPVTQPETADVTPAPRPSPSSDVTESMIPDDLREANEYVRRNGLLGTVYFDFDSSSLSSSARDRLARNAKFLTENTKYVITVEGHCDERGTNEYNIALGDRRSNTAIDYLTSLGVSGSRLKTVSYGEERPSCNDSSEGCWGRNRRAEFQLTGQM